MFILRAYTSVTELPSQDVKYLDRASSGIRYSAEVQKAQLSVRARALSVTSAPRSPVVSRISAPPRAAVAA